MTRNSIIISVVAVVAAALLGWWAFGYLGFNQSAQIPQDTQAGNHGNLYLSITDAAVDMKNVTAVNMTIDKVYVHSAAQNWMAVSVTPMTVELLDLHANNKAVLLAKVSAMADSYDQVWVHISKVTVTESGKVKTATLPKADFIMQGKATLNKNTDTIIELDFLADQSLHKTEKGEMVFTPVVAFESRSNATVTVGNGNVVTVTGGNIDTAATAGMDLDGTVKADFKVNTDANLELNNGIINLKGAATTGTTLKVGQ